MQTLISTHGPDLQVVIDTGMELREVEEIDMGASDEGVVIWCGDTVE